VSDEQQYPRADGRGTSDDAFYGLWNIRDSWDYEYQDMERNPPVFPTFDNDVPAGSPNSLFEQIEPPANLWESVIESMMGFAARIAGIDIPEALTATQAVIEHAFGRPRTAEAAPTNISQAMRFDGDQGILNRNITSDGWLARRAQAMQAERDGEDEEGGGVVQTGLLIRAAIGLARGFGRVAGALGPVGIGIAVLVAGVVGAAVVLKKMSNMGWEQVNAVAKFNGALLGAQKRIEVGNILRDIEMANALQKSGAEHLDNQERINEALHYWKLMWGKLSSRLGAWATGVIADWAENPLGAIADSVMSDTLLEWTGLGADFDDVFVDSAKQLGSDLFNNPLATVAGGAIDMMMPDALLEALGMGAETDDKLIEEVKDFFKWAKIKWPGQADKLKLDPLMMHNHIIGPAFDQQPAPLAGLGAAPAQP